MTDSRSATVKLPPAIEDHPAIGQWISMDKEGRISLYTGRVELGQGVLTALAQIAADELDVAFERIDIYSGDTRQTPDEGTTAGSRSMEVGGSSVRLAASAARHLALEEAAKLLQSDPVKLSIEDGLIHVEGRASDLTYWTLAAKLDLTREVKDYCGPKPIEARRQVDKSQSRIDLPDKITGQVSFIHDLKLSGMLHGRVLHPPSLNARCQDFNGGELEDLPGVIKFVRDGSFIGVIAEEEIDALRAIQKAEILTQWSAPLPDVGDPISALEKAETQSEISFSEGDPFSLSGKKIGTRVTRPYIAHGSIGPCCAIALWEGDQLTVRSHSQGVFPLRQALADVFRIEAEKVDVMHFQGAGCYGHNGADDVALDAALLAKAVPGRPVKVVWSRADELTSAPFGPGMITLAEAILNESNTIEGMIVDVTSPPHVRRPGRNGTPNLLAAEYIEKAVPAAPGTDVPLSGGGGADRNAVPWYDIPHISATKHIALDLPFRYSSMRGLGGFLNVFALETLMDDIAHEIAIDPIQLRLDHLKDPRARAVITQVAEAAQWPGDLSDNQGLGIGFARYKNHAAYCAVVVLVELEENVRIKNAWASVDAGECINPDGIRNQIEGGIIQSISWTTKEAVTFEQDVPVSRDWESYPILTFPEVPEIEVAIIKHSDKPLLGVGEASQGPTAAAIGNAIRQALGVRVRNLPLNRDAIAAAIG